MARSRIKQTDGCHPGTGRVRLRRGNKIAERRVEALAQRLERVQVDLGAVALRSSLEGAHVVDDRSHSVDDALHRLEDPSGGVGPACGEQTVDGGDEACNMDVDEAAVPRDR